MADFTTQQNTLQTCNNNKQSPSHVAVVMVPLPAQGHLNQLLHLSRLISAYNLPVHYLAAATHIRQAKLRLHGWSPASSIYFHEFPTTSFENPQPDPFAPHKFPSQIVPSLLASTNLRKPVYDYIQGLSRIFDRVIVIYDFLMSYVVQDMDCIKNAECYIFRSISAISVCSWESKSWTVIPPEARIFLKEIPSVTGYYSDKFSEFLSLQYNARNVSSGDIFNSNSEIEGLFLDLLSKIRKKIWAIGPFNPILITKPSKSGHNCLEWLDKQEAKSVMYVSFGTSCSFSEGQIREIALGLERSDRKFVWVLREADRGDIFRGEKERESGVPLGFEERVGGRGIIVKDWAPQLEILGHASTGGFMSHCGWNSVVESVSLGVPMAAWPMHSDQPANAVLVTRVLKVGVLVKGFSREEGEEELVESGRVESVVRELMDSEEMRKRAIELGQNVRDSLMETGAARKDIDSFIDHLTR